MNKFRTILESALGNFLVDAIHENSKVLSLGVFPIVNGKIAPSIAVDKSNWSELIEQIEKMLKP